MRTFLIVVAVIALLFAVLLVYAATKPDSFAVQRTTTIKAPPENVFALINDFHEWGSWSPYEKLDPAMTKTYSGAANGTGAVYEWKGKTSTVGAGRIEITEAAPASKVALNLDMSEPFEGHNKVEFTLEPTGDSTNVTWAMRGPSPYLTKVMSVFINMDTMIGGQFEEGLANMKAVAEK